MKPFRQRRRTSERRGTAAVEAALVLPVFMLFIFALIEFGHAMMVNNVIRSACRDGARYGSTEGISTSDVENRVSQVVSGAVDPSHVQIYVKNADIYDDGGTPPTTGEGIEALPDLELTEAESRQMFLVRAKVDYYNAAIVPIDLPILGPFLKNITLEGQAFMRHE